MAEDTKPIKSTPWTKRVY